MEPHLELSPPIAEVLRETRDGLFDGVKADDVHIAVDQVRLGEKLVPVAVRRACEQRARAPAGQRRERKRDFPPLVRTTLLGKSLAGQAHADIGKWLVALADHAQADLPAFASASDAPGGEAGGGPGGGGGPAGPFWRRGPPPHEGGGG